MILKMCGLNVNNILCIIPARAGSKGVPSKNLMKLGDKPLVGHSIQHAIDAGIPLNHIVVSSNSHEVLDYAFLAGVIPYGRPEELCSDTSPTELAMLDALEIFPKMKDIILLQPTSPIRFPGRVKQCIDAYRSGDYDSLVTVSNVHNFIWTERKQDGQYDWFCNYNPRSRPMRQQQKREELIYTENGNIYITNIEMLKTHKCRIGDKVCVHKISEIEGLQLDTHSDLKILQALFKKHNWLSCLEC